MCMLVGVVFRIYVKSTEIVVLCAYVQGVYEVSLPLRLAKCEVNGLKLSRVDFKFFSGQKILNVKPSKIMFNVVLEISLDDP